MPYTPDQIWEIGEMHAEWLERESALTRRLFAHLFESARAREMMQHGLSRRLADLRHGVDRIFEVLPPDVNDPSQRDVRDATAVNRRLKGTPYRRAIGTPFWGS